MHWPPPLAIPEWLEEEADGAAPEFFRCPITLCLMREPTQTPAGCAPLLRPVPDPHVRATAAAVRVWPVASAIVAVDLHQPCGARAG